jgi:hypothetical protein
MIVNRLTLTEVAITGRFPVIGKGRVIVGWAGGVIAYYSVKFNTFLMSGRGWVIRSDWFRMMMLLAEGNRLSYDTLWYSIIYSKW